MTNGHDIIDELGLEKQIENWSDPDKFMARQLFKIKNNCAACTAQSADQLLKLNDHEERLKAVESCTTKPAASTRQLAITAGTGGGIAGIIIYALLMLAQLLGWVKL